MSIKASILIIMLPFLGAGCINPAPSRTTDFNQQTNINSSHSMEISSDAFMNNQAIPRQYTCDGSDSSPNLDFNGVPTGTKSLVLIVDDPDAPGGTFDHWILFNIPPQTTGISPGGSAGTVGKNSFGNIAYGGPCPPDREHRYFFKLYALDAELALQTGTSKKAVEEAMQGHILEQAVLMGTYDRPR